MEKNLLPKVETTDGLGRFVSALKIPSTGFIWVEVEDVMKKEKSSFWVDREHDAGQVEWLMTILSPVQIDILLN